MAKLDYDDFWSISSFEAQNHGHIWIPNYSSFHSIGGGYFTKPERNDQIINGQVLQEQRQPPCFKRHQQSGNYQENDAGDWRRI